MPDQHRRTRRQFTSRGCGSFTGMTFRWSGGPGESHPRAPTDPCVTVSRYTALVVLVLWRAGFTQAQCAKYRGRFPAASAMARMAFLHDRSFLYFFMDHRSM